MYLLLFVFLFIIIVSMADARNQEKIDNFYKDEELDKNKED